MNRKGLKKKHSKIRARQDAETSNERKKNKKTRE